MITWLGNTICTASTARKLANSEHQLLGQGILIFDEVTVQSKVMWNSKTNEILRLTVSKDNLHSLHDMYASVKDEKGLQMTSHILQFL